MNTRIIAVVLTCALVVPALASAQPARWLGMAVAAAGAAMLTIDAEQPVQPLQPGIVPGDVLAAEVADFLGSDLFVQRLAETGEVLYGDRIAYDCLGSYDCVFGFGIGAISGGVAGAAGALAIADYGDRTVYAGPFQPLVPYQERSPGLKYGGAAMVIGGAALAALWPNQPAFRDISVAPVRGGGVHATKSFGF